MMDWSERGNINTAAQVTTAQCSTLVVQCSRQLIGPADWVFVTLGPLHCANSLEAVSYFHIVTQWSGSGRTEAYLSVQLASYSALTLLVGLSDL